MKFHILKNLGTNGVRMYNVQNIFDPPSSGLVKIRSMIYLGIMRDISITFYCITCNYYSTIISRLFTFTNITK